MFGMTRLLAQSRDSQRTASVSSVAEALEKYYDKNGEYPSCADITASGPTITTTLFKGMDPTALVVPGAPSSTTNSIQCGSTLTPTSSDSFQYIGDGSTDCSGSGKCLSFALKYKDEVDGTIKEIDSRRNTAIATSGTPVLTATVGGSTSVNANWTTIPNALSYRIQTSAKNDTSFTSPIADTVLSATNTTITSLAQGTMYNFRVAAQSGGNQTSWSAPVAVTTNVDAPNSTPTLTAAMSGSTAQATSGAVTCNGGMTPQYSFQWYKTATAAAGSWSSWTAKSTTKTYGQANASQAYKYAFQVQAVCVGPDNTSAPSSTSATATVVVPYSTPPTPGYAGPGSFTSGNFYIVNFSSSCPAGTSLTNANYTSVSWDGSNFGPHPFGYNDWWTLGPAGGANVTYKGYYQCTNYYGTSPLSPVSNTVVNVHY
jgi:hypothetical protein